MRPIAAAAAVATGALVLGLAGPAHAALYGIDDPQETGRGYDVLALSVNNGSRNLTVTTQHVDLRRNPRSGTGAAIFVDTDRTDPGPEFVFVGGYFDGTDYALLHTEGFARSTWGSPVEDGDYQLRLNYRKDRARVVISQAALGEPRKVRVSVRASGNRGPVDWVGKPRSYSLWLTRG